MILARSCEFTRERIASALVLQGHYFDLTYAELCYEDGSQLFVGKLIIAGLDEQDRR